MKIKTIRLKPAVDMVAKGLGDGKFFEVTAYIHLQAQNKKLSLTSTDTARFITVTLPIEEDVQFDAIIDGQKFIELVKKTTTDYIEIKHEVTHLLVTGNGCYKFDLFAGEFPTYQFTPEGEQEVDLFELKKALKQVGPAVAKDMVVPYLAGYLVADHVVATDGVKVGYYAKPFLEYELLLPAELVDLIDLLSDANVLIRYNKNAVQFKTSSVTIYSGQLGGVEEYPNLQGLVEEPMSCVVEVERLALMKALDRVSIFTEDINDFAVKVAYSDNEVVIQSVDGQGTESLAGVCKGQVFKQYFNVKYLTDLLSVLNDEKVTIQYEPGKDFIKIVSGELIQILATVSLEGDTDES